MQVRTITEEYIRDRLLKGRREGRQGLLSYRSIHINPKTMPNAEGSAEVSIGDTKVVAGVKIDLGEPMNDTPEEGTISTAAELLPMASETYDPGPPSPEAIEISRVIDRGIRAAGIIDATKLFIEEGKVWNVYIDVYVLNYDGNLFDAGTLAATTALLTSRMPRYEDGAVVREGNLARLETKNIVTSCTFAKVANSIILDPDGNEEIFADARLTVANDEEYLRAMQKGISGSLSVQEIDSMVSIAFDKSKELRSAIKSSLGD